MQHRRKYGIDILHRLDMDPALFLSILPSDEATFPQPGKVNRHNIWGFEDPRSYRELIRDSLKLNV
jgi:hypothetical protein